MKIRLLVLDKQSCYGVNGIPYGLVEFNGGHSLFKPVKIQVSDTFDKETGEFIDWDDVDVVYESVEESK